MDYQGVRIAFDHQCFWERFGGVSKYFVELISRLPEEAVLMPRCFSDNEYMQAIPGIKCRSFLPGITFRGKTHLIREFGKIFSIPMLKFGKYDIYHPTHYDCYGLDIVPKHVKTVATIHDMNFFVISHLYSRMSSLAGFQKKMVDKADHIITVSNKSKQDMMEIWDIPDEKIDVIYHGINTDAIARLPRHKISEDYILFVGRRAEYKNFHGLLQALAILTGTYSDLKLYCAGPAFSQEETSLMQSLGVRERCRAFQATDSQLYDLYRNASAFVFPSFYEGFGLPILEAMACECPTLVSNTSCFPEIAGDAAAYFDPADAESIADRIRTVLDDSELRRSLVARGSEHVKKFSWDECARRHMDVYTRLAGS